MFQWNDMVHFQSLKFLLKSKNLGKQLTFYFYTENKGAIPLLLHILTEIIFPKIN